MGEIADAIRRARERGESRERELTLPTLRSTQAEAAAPAAPEAPPPTPPEDTGSSFGLDSIRSRVPFLGKRVESVEVTNEAVILEDGARAEECRHLALRLRAELEERGARSVAVASAERADGKSTVLCDLGIALASLSRGREIALVDLDLRKPSLGRYLSLPEGPGIEDVLRRKVTLDEVRVEIENPTLDVYQAVEPQRAAHELLVQPAFAAMIQELESRYATVLIDTPPALLVPDVTLVLRHVGACVPVARAGKTRARNMRQLVGRLPRKQMLPAILNGQRTGDADDEYGYYGVDVVNAVVEDDAPPKQEDAP
ncbi:MAG: CpsD/CapB family tyrosine-protein kinase [Myxococcota bacterium]